MAGEIGKPEAAGNFHRYPLPKLLFYLYRKQFTGTMVITVGLSEHRLHLREGLPVRAEIADGEPSSKIFVDSGWIAPELYSQAEAMARRTSRSIAEVLRAMGALTADQLAHARKQQLLTELCALFRMPDADFAIYRVDHEHGRTKEDLARMRVHPRRVALAGIRAAYDMKRLESEFGPELEVRGFRIDPDAYGALGHYGFAADDKPLLEQLCSGWRSIDVLTQMTGRAPLDIARILYALRVTGALETQPEGVEVSGAIVVERKVATPVPVTQVAGGSRPGTYRFSGRTLAPEARSERLSLSGASGVTPPSQRQPARRPARTEEARALVDKIQSTGRFLGQLDHFELLGVARDATREQIRAAWLEKARLFDAKRLEELGLGAHRETVERIQLALQAARDVLSDDGSRREYAQTLDGPAAGNPERAAKLVEARHEQALGETALRGNRLELAEKHLRRAVELAPDAADAIALLAFTTYRMHAPGSPELIEKVRHELLRAAKLAPQNPRPVYLLGEVALASGDLGKAIAYFRRTLEIDESHVDAERGLRLATMRKEKSGKGSLFGRTRRDV